MCSSDLPDVEMVAAVGRPDAHAGEIPVAYVKLRVGADATADALKAYARAHVRERAAAPDWVEPMALMPTTAVGKIFKPALRRRAIERAVLELLAAEGIEASVTAHDDARHGTVADVVLVDGTRQARAQALCGALALHTRLATAGPVDADPARLSQ